MSCHPTRLELADAHLTGIKRLGQSRQVTQQPPTPQQMIGLPGGASPRHRNLTRRRPSAVLVVIARDIPVVLQAVIEPPRLRPIDLTNPRLHPRQQLRRLSAHRGGPRPTHNSIIRSRSDRSLSRTQLTTRPSETPPRSVTEQPVQPTPPRPRRVSTRRGADERSTRLSPSQTTPCRAVRAGPKRASTPRSGNH